jgi:hypothetical protein
MTAMWQVELAKHPDGHVLYVRPLALRAPWVRLKLKLHGRFAKKLGERSNVWLTWNCAKRQFSATPYALAFSESKPDVYDWALEVLERQPDGWVDVVANGEKRLDASRVSWG